MKRRAVVVMVTLGASLAVSAAGAAPAPDRQSAAPQSATGVPHGDRNGNRIDDALESRLVRAQPDTRMDVVVTGLPVTRARQLVGAFAVRRQLPMIDGFSAIMTAGQARALARQPDVRRVEAVTQLHTTDDGTNSDFGVVAARADRPGLDGSGVGICIVDTGVDAAHEQIVPRTVVFRDFVGTGTTAYDDHGHGTHVASIAAGDGTGGPSAASFAGVAPASSLYAAKVLDSSGSGPNDAVIAGVEWCAAQPGVDVISMSLGDDAGGDGSDAVSLAVNQAVQGGDVVVVAAGNSGDSPKTISAPGVATGALTVGAVAEWSNPVGTAWHDDGIWLAAFSSRGPTTDGRTKPDMTAPGVTVQAARANSGSGYVSYSGTSMATPYVAGAVALALQANPAATPAQVRAAVTGTALDAGAPGPDNEWGAGLVDARALVDAVAGSATPRRTPMPTFVHVSGSVPDHGSTTLPIEVPAGGLGLPLSVTVTLAGTGGCVVIFGACWPVEWSPDLDVELIDPNGIVAARSECALNGLTCAYGRQETVAVRPSVAGIWHLRVFTFEGGPDDGAGGTFVADISRGPLVGALAPPPPPPPPNAPPVANAGPDQRLPAITKNKVGTFTLDGRGSTDPDGSIAGWSWTQNGAVVGTSPTVTLSRKIGTWVFRLTVTDDDGATDTDEVTVTVTRR